MELPFKTLHQFNDFFKDERTCYEWYEKIRWEDGQAVCPHCATAKKPYTARPRGKFTDIPSYRCSERACSLPFTVRTASIFEGSKVEFRKWLLAMYELNTSKKGISSVELGTRIGVSQKTAWFINHRLRTMLTDEAPEVLGGEDKIVEVDETYVGGKAANKHESVRKALKEGTGYINKTPVVAMIERGGKIKTQTFAGQDSVTNEDLTPLISKMVAPASTLVTDGYGGYHAVGKLHTAHEVVNHSAGEFKRGNFHTNTVEGFFSLLDRGIIGIYHYVSEQHLHRYCMEFEHRYNERAGSNVERFGEMIEKADTKRITYRKLVDNGKGIPRPHKRKIKPEA